MGLDNFKSDDSSWSSGNSGGGRGKKQSAADHDDSHDAYKIIWNGKHTLPIESNEIVIETKELWEKVATFINKKMGITNEEFNSRPPERKYEIVSNAIDVVEHEDHEPYGQDEQCSVCGKDFVFPDDWDFVEFDDMMCCPTHTIEEAMEAQRESSTEV